MNTTLIVCIQCNSFLLKFTFDSCTYAIKGVRKAVNWHPEAGSELWLTWAPQRCSQAELQTEEERERVNTCVYISTSETVILHTPLALMPHSDGHNDEGDRRLCWGYSSHHKQTFLCSGSIAMDSSKKAEMQIRLRVVLKPHERIWPCQVSADPI